MDYPLAKALKEAGFRQEGNGRSIVDPRLIVARRVDRAYVPTLEELVEACGERFHSLIRCGKVDWDACEWAEPSAHIQPIRVKGSTPEKAVAMLWLGLNKR